MNTRRAGQRTLAKARRYAEAQGMVFLPLYQASWFASPQPFDALCFQCGEAVRLIEVRTGQWGVAKPQTRRFAQLPGEWFIREIWRFRPGQTTPDIRVWDGRGWVWWEWEPV